MSKTLTLPSGATVKLRDPKSLKHKDRKRIYNIDAESGSYLAGIELLENIIAILVEEWSFDLVPPSVKIESLGELDLADYDALQAECETALGTLFPQLAKTIESEQDPKVITENSAD